MREYQNSCDTLEKTPESKEKSSNVSGKRSENLKAQSRNREAFEKQTPKLNKKNELFKCDSVGCNKTFHNERKLRAHLRSHVSLI
jgi:hypothetical protein